MSCYCHKCKKDFHPLGIMRHRAMHRDKKETVKITFSDGRCSIYDYGKKEPDLRCKNCGHIQLNPELLELDI